MLQLYNTLGRKLTEFSAIGGTTFGGKPAKVGLYTCGPTVYDFAHIGNMRTYIFEDVLKRVLLYNNYSVNHIMNITDFGHLSSDTDFNEDKNEKGAKTVEDVMAIAEKYTKAFETDLVALNILFPDKFTKATDHVADQIELIKKLKELGFAYETDLAVYFEVQKFPEYGKLTGQKLKDRLVGVRDEIVVDKQKKHPADFALWFKLVGKYQNHILRWGSPWGQGFPGWHIECSAMSTKYLGQPFDIHTGGVDHIFPHHTNEIAQSEAAEDKPMANFWLHSEFLLIDAGRMGKSEGNLITINTAIEKGFNPLAFRYLVLTSHYRTKLNFSWESLTSAQNALNNLYQEISSITTKAAEGLPKYEEEFLKAVNNDLDMPKAIAVIWNMIKSEEDNSKKLTSLIKFDEILGLKIEEVWKTSSAIPKIVRKLIEERQVARETKNFKKSDELRIAIESNGYLIEDNTDGQKIKKSFRT